MSISHPSTILPKIFSAQGWSPVVAIPEVSPHRAITILLDPVGFDVTVTLGFIKLGEIRLLFGNKSDFATAAASEILKKSRLKSEACSGSKGWWWRGTPGRSDPKRRF